MKKILCNTWVTVVILSTLIAIGFFLIYNPYKPVHLVAPPSSLVDDADRESLIAVMEHQHHYLETQEPNSTVFFGTSAISNSWLLISLEELLEFVKRGPTEEELSTFIRTHYDFFRAGGRKSTWRHEMLVTGYYEPLFEGSYEAYPPYQTPLYSPPPSLVKKTHTDGKKQIGRLDEQHNFVPFWTRQEIETEGYLEGNELVYLKDPFDAYLLHVQGSGKIQLPDGTIRSLGFAGTNGLEYKSIGKVLVERGVMKLPDVTIPAIRQYLKENPQERMPLLHQNPRYIFFNWNDNSGPRGSSGEPLTAGRSIAIDPQALPTGTIGYLVSEKPVVAPDQSISSWEPMRRLVFPQDSGSAIKGTGRVDVFWGNGTYAETAANHMKQPGELFFLVKKGEREQAVSP